MTAEEKLSEMQRGFYRGLDLAVSELGRAADSSRHANLDDKVTAQLKATRHIADALHWGGLYLVARFDQLMAPRIVVPGLDGALPEPETETDP